MENVAGLYPRHNNRPWPDGARHLPGGEYPTGQTVTDADGRSPHRTAPNLPAMELHDTTAVSSPDLSVTPGTCFLTPPKQQNERMVPAESIFADVLVGHRVSIVKYQLGAHQLRDQILQLPGSQAN